MKKVVVLIALSIALVMSCVAIAGAATVTPGTPALIASGGTGTTVITANVLPRVYLTVPSLIAFGDLAPTDTASQGYTVTVKATETFAIARSVDANDWGLSVSGDVPVAAGMPGNRTYNETADVTVPWGVTSGAKSTNVVYTVTFP